MPVLFRLNIKVISISAKQEVKNQDKKVEIHYKLKVSRRKSTKFNKIQTLLPWRKALEFRVFSERKKAA